MKRIIKDYLSFTRRERIAVIILLVVMAAFIGVPYLYQPKFEAPPADRSLEDFLMAANDAKTDSAGNEHTESVKPNTATVFAFDPNTISEKEWMRLGVSSKTVRTIINYRNKGGRFSNAEAIRKIWGLSKADAERLVPYVRIANEQHIVDRLSVKRNSDAKTIHPVDINTALLNDLVALPGIGAVLGNRIIKYRERLGGFFSVEQVRNTYGISDSSFATLIKYLRIDTATIPKLNINTAGIYELRMRLDIPYNIAKTIVTYRELNGPFHSVNDVQTIARLTAASLRRLQLIGVIDR